jgi:hypothetical protein
MQPDFVDVPLVLKEIDLQMDLSIQDTGVIGSPQICLVVSHRVSRFVGQIGDQAAGVRDAFFLCTKMTLRSWFQLDASSLLARRSKKSPVRTCKSRFRLFGEN